MCKAPFHHPVLCEEYARFLGSGAGDRQLEDDAEERDRGEPKRADGANWGVEGG